MIRALAKRKSIRMHELVELVEDRRKEVERHSWPITAQRRQQRNHKGKPEDSPGDRVAHGKPAAKILTG